MAERSGRFAALSVCVMLSGCAAHQRPVTPDRLMILNGHSLRLHFANAGPAPSRPLLVYATGDGGMHRKDLDTYCHLVSWGYPIVGFDARDYVKHLGGSNTTTPEQLAADYMRMIAAARESLRLDAAGPVVLIGVSRGAGLSVVAAGELHDAIYGVIAIALTREEEYVHWYRRLRVLPRRPVMVDVQEYLPQLRDLPLAVVQSTHDQYLPAPEARTLLGPDGPRRWMQAIEAHNHSFGGARGEMYAALQRALDWIESLIANPEFRTANREPRTANRGSRIP